MTQHSVIALIPIIMIISRLQAVKFNMKGPQSFPLSFSFDNTGQDIFPKTKFWLGGNSEKKIAPVAQNFIIDISNVETIIGDLADTQTKFGLDCQAINGCSLIYPDSKSICRYENWVGLCT